jgi:hypothetical protein
MKAERMTQEAVAVREAKSDGRALLAEYLAQQPQSRRTFDRFMKVLEVAGAALVAGCLAWAIYVSINWSVPQEIAAIWLALPAIISVLLIFVGLHAAGLRAFFPLGLLAGTQKLVTGSEAMVMGVGFAVACLLAGAFWGTFAWGLWTANLSLLMPLTQVMGVVIGVGVVVAVVSDLYKKLFRSR